MNFLPNERFSELIDLLKSGKIDIHQRSADTPEYKQFIKDFPAASLSAMTLDQYLIGTGNHNSFCWWIERGLQPVLGRYMPGTARGHILYRMRNGTIYKNRLLSHLSDEEALHYTLNIQAAIANAKPTEDLRWIDDDQAIYQRAGVKPLVTIGDGRKLRLLNCYHPDKTIPISSSDHLGHYLIIFGFPETDMPSIKQPVARMLFLFELFEEARKQIPDLTTTAFMKALYNKELGVAPLSREKRTEKDMEEEVEAEEMGNDLGSQPVVNLILYGPPGTGKTYATIDETLKIIDPIFYDENVETRHVLKDRFDELIDSKQVRFVTFHQSFSYEDFVEGLRAENDENGVLRYEVVDGIFKTLCEAAVVRVIQQAKAPIDLTNRRTWKMSLGESQSDESYLFDEGIQQGHILLGYGETRDFRGCNSTDLIRQRFSETGDQLGKNDYAITAINTFVNKMKIGDLVVVTDGNLKFRAIGEITGDYKLIDRESQGDHYGQSRTVKWLRVYSPSLPYDQLMNNRFSQMTLYELRPGSIDMDKLAGLLGSKSATSSGTEIEPNLPINTPGSARVLIIDEINRGNISRILGELITLIEPSKRQGAAEALEVTLPYSKTRFSIPGNVFIIGTMNTADRSLAGLDIALRRRFTFKEMPPRPELLDEINIGPVNMGQLLRTMNERIEVLIDRDRCLGHAYFMSLKDEPSLANLAFIFRQQILPLLQEYFFEDWERIAWVLNNQPFVQKVSKNLTSLFSADAASNLQNSDRRWRINEAAFTNIESYRGILGASA